MGNPDWAYRRALVSYLKANSADPDSGIAKVSENEEYDVYWHRPIEELEAMVRLSYPNHQNYRIFSGGQNLARFIEESHTDEMNAFACRIEDYLSLFDCDDKFDEGSTERRMSMPSIEELLNTNEFDELVKISDDRVKAMLLTIDAGARTKTAECISIVEDMLEHAGVSVGTCDRPETHIGTEYFSRLMLALAKVIGR